MGLTSHTHSLPRAASAPFLIPAANMSLVLCALIPFALVFVPLFGAAPFAKDGFISREGCLLDIGRLDRTVAWWMEASSKGNG